MCKFKVNNDRAHEEHCNRHKALTDSMDRKLSDSMARFSSEHDAKHEEHRRNLQASNGELIGMIQKEITQLAETVDIKYRTLCESTTSEAVSIREEIARVLVLVDEKCERGIALTTSTFSTMQQTLDMERTYVIDQLMSEKDTRTREIKDLCGAVKSMQDWISDVEGSFSQDREGRTRESESFVMRITEIKDITTSLRSEMIKQQQHIEQFKGLQVDKITDELRKVVQDLALTSDFQGGKIKELEVGLDHAVEAKREVHRLRGDLDAEMSTRTMKDSELEKRLEREVHEFSRRVDRLTAATSELGGDLQKTRSTAWHRSGSATPTSLSSVGVDRTTMLRSSSHNPSRLGSMAGSLNYVDS